MESIFYSASSPVSSPSIVPVMRTGTNCTADHEVEAGEFVPVRITGTMDGELTGELAE